MGPQSLRHVAYSIHGARDDVLGVNNTYTVGYFNPFLVVSVASNIVFCNYDNNKRVKINQTFLQCRHVE